MVRSCEVASGDKISEPVKSSLRQAHLHHHPSVTGVASCRVSSKDQLPWTWVARRRTMNCRATKVTATKAKASLKKHRQKQASGSAWSEPGWSGDGFFSFPKGTTTTRQAIAVPLLALTMQCHCRAPVPESTGLLTRFVSNVPRVFSGSGRRAKRRRACSAASTSAGGCKRPCCARKASNASAAEDTSAAPCREAHGPATPREKQSQ